MQGAQHGKSYIGRGVRGGAWWMAHGISRLDLHCLMPLTGHVLNGRKSSRSQKSCQSISDPIADIDLSSIFADMNGMTDKPETIVEQPKTIEFAPWMTAVENDDLTLVGVRYGGHEAINFAKDDHTVELTLDYDDCENELEATFISREKMAGVVFYFNDVDGFRVLDEHGLVDLWNASMDTPRPASTTFKVKGHLWQTESELSWIMRDCEFSYMVATNGDCLEVITGCEPSVKIIPAVVRKKTAD
ncbi:hypothetical protein ACNI3Q_13255 [Sphingomonas sp. FW199]|uniref:hypothetical protein n=1 Tax=Sphingomonas sp. FW199 TaxID=3400217 RepID=UPI003CF3D112